MPAVHTVRHALIRPEQYPSARLHRLDWPSGRTLASLLAWTSPFTARSVIAKRITLPHRDLKDHDSWLDMLVTFGPYINCRMEL